MNHGRVQLVRISEVDEAVDRAKEELTQALVMIENLNEPFIRESRKVNPPTNCKNRNLKGLARMEPWLSSLSI